MAEVIRALLVDDEAPAREAMTDALSGFSDILIVGEAANGFEAVRMVHDLKPDLLFLDIQMPRLDGFDVVELLGNEAPVVVFVTAHDEHALRAFEAQAVDYLLKPVRRERLAAALERVRLLIGREAPVMEALVRSHKEGMVPLERLLIRDGVHVHIIPVADIIYIEAEDDYAAIHTKGQTLLKYERMASLEQLLDPAVFCRIHRSCILNIKYLKKIEPWSKDKKVAVLADGNTLPISRSGHERLMGLF